jgi:16S rRNA (guanine966-N2)-methyltransferase
MRIIAGLYKGRQLQTVADFSVRPATGRVRQTLFDMLTSRISFEGLHVLDLFAGCGSLGFESLSRGASRVTFVESSTAALQSIEANAKSLQCLPSVEILRMDAMRFLASSGDTYGLIFADPPYAFGQTSSLPGLVMEKPLLTPGGFLLIEHASDCEFPSHDAVNPGPVKRFGRTIVSFFQHRQAQP